MSKLPYRTLQQTRTSMPPGQVLAAAKRFFLSRSSLYATFLEHEGPTYVGFRGQGGEELLIGVAEDGAATAVTGSTYMFDQQIARFFTTLPPVPEASGDAKGGAKAVA